MSDHDDWTLIDRGDHTGLYRHHDGRVAVLDIAALRHGHVHDARHPPPRTPSHSNHHAVT